VLTTPPANRRPPPGIPRRLDASGNAITLAISSGLVSAAANREQIGCSHAAGATPDLMHTEIPRQLGQGGAFRVCVATSAPGAPCPERLLTSALFHDPLPLTSGHPRSGAARPSFWKRFWSDPPPGGLRDTAEAIRWHPPWGRTPWRAERPGYLPPPRRGALRDLSRAPALAPSS